MHFFSKRTLFSFSISFLILLLLSCVSAFAANPPGMPPRGKVLLGLGGTAIGPREFDRLTGAQHKIHLITINWDEHREQGWHYALLRRFEEAERGDYRLMIHIGAFDNSGRVPRTPAAVAQGAADAYFLDLGREINERDEYIYVRPPAEMNGHWSPWAAFTRGGSSKGSQYSTANYRRSFIRIAEIVRGGSVAEINTRLRKNGMPALNTKASDLPSSGKISLVWNPQAEGSPNVRGNQPKDFYPGKAWVDYFATDIYEQSGRAAWKQNESFYNQYKKAHPFMIAEFAPWGYDGASYIDRIFAWTRSHPRTVALMYFNGTGGSTFRLASKPKSLAMYKSKVRSSVFKCDAFSAISSTC